MQFNHSTQAQFRARLREEYRNATKGRVLQIAKYVQGLELTDNQLKNLFNVNDARLSTLKTRLANQASLCDSARSAVGE